MAKDFDSVKKMEKEGVKLTKSEKALVRKADDFLQKAKDGKMSESEAMKKVGEIYGKLTTYKNKK